LSQQAIAFLDLGPKNRFLRGKLAAHRPPLRSLAAEDEGQLAIWPDVTGR